MTARTSDALASALPAGVSTAIGLDVPMWHAREIAKYQAERLAEAGYVLVHAAPDEATVERLARANHAIECGCPGDPPNAYYSEAERALRIVAALGAAAPAERDGEVGE